MDKKYLLILLVVCIFGGAFFLERIIQTKMDKLEDPINDSPVEEIPEKGFKDLKLTYFGRENRYQMDATLKRIVQKTNDNLNFEGLEAVLIDRGQVLQHFFTEEGWMTTKDGVVYLNGPITFQAGEYQLMMNKANIDLNQGYFQGRGSIFFESQDFQIEAEELSSDFQLKKIHFSGRPRLIIKKGG
ncbi:hypothetical protein BBF96_11400 [Anoxybacter fermentans]|uniref:LPS export ABC transporter periplasmic protein LptC n=1 Tax=Anoxybacter fermentans TaxID=1323375 RepID=A0A3S9T069_9FIRM|nr:LPS export ABC transporter periplasmic protein LptC [Anoxybacter fermentans]AZR73944.1 hypothetical protein BBF96_11400 [Anoxybacter fermentans]